MKRASDDLFERRWIVDVLTYVSDSVNSTYSNVLVRAHCDGSFCSSTISQLRMALKSKTEERTNLVLNSTLDTFLDESLSCRQASYVIF